MIGTIIKEQATAEYFFPCAGDIKQTRRAS